MKHRRIEAEVATSEEMSILVFPHCTFTYILILVFVLSSNCPDFFIFNYNILCPFSLTNIKYFQRMKEKSHANIWRLL